MKADHVRVHTLGVHWVAANRAFHSHGGIGHRLRQQGFGLWFPALAAVLGMLLVFA